MIFEYNLQFFAKDGEGGEKTEERKQLKRVVMRQKEWLAVVISVTFSDEIACFVSSSRLFCQLISAI